MWRRARAIARLILPGLEKRRRISDSCCTFVDKRNQSFERFFSGKKRITDKSSRKLVK